MSVIELDRFIAIMKALFGGYVDEYWGPIGGPFGPVIHPGQKSGPMPDPWRALRAAYQVVSLADALELSGDGTGVSLLKRFAEDPDNWCGTRFPGWPRPPKGEPSVDPAVLGAALVFVADGIGSESLAETTRALGTEMIR